LSEQNTEERKEKRSFLMYVDFPEVATMLDDKAFRELVTAMCYYTQHRTAPAEMSQTTALVFSVLKVTLDREYKEWVKTCEKNRQNILKRWYGETTEASENNRKQAKQPKQPKQAKNSQKTGAEAAAAKKAALDALDRNDPDNDDKVGEILYSNSW